MHKIVHMVPVRNFCKSLLTVLADIFMNLHNAVGKSLVPKVLVSLADKGLITAKTFGKTVIYVARQDRIPAPSNKEIEEIDKDIAFISETLNAERESTKQAQHRIFNFIARINR